MTNKAVTTPPPHPLVVLRERLINRRDELRNALTDIDPDHFIRALVTSADLNPELQTCSWHSLWQACMRACRDNLLPDGREGAIVPFKSKATWIPMYQGLLKQFRQSGECKWIAADVVRDGEVFEHWVDQTGQHFKHVPEGDESKPIGKVYAAALTKDGAFYVAVMSITEINKIRAMSRASRDDSPWKMWPGQMMKKTALRRLSKLLPAGHDLFADEDEPIDEGPSGGEIDRRRLSSMTDALDMIAAKEPARKKAEALDEDDPSEVIDEGEYAASDDELPLDRDQQEDRRHGASE